MNENHQHEHHVTPLSLYLAIFFALLVLTAATVWVATIDLGWANDVVAMAVAVTKALLVIIFFMHVRHSTRMVKITAIAGFFWLAIMLIVTMADYKSRDKVIEVPVEALAVEGK